LYTASNFIFPKHENEIMKRIMFGAQTAKQYQSNGQKYEDEMKDNPKLGVKRKTQKSVKHKLKVTRILKTMSHNGRSILQLSKGRSKRTQTARCQ
jgi:hypothetical protein